MKQPARILQFSAFLLALLACQAVSAFPVPPKMAAWYADRFGMFIHFGSYSLPGRGEWVFSNENWAKADYQTQISSNFNPVNFDATAIATAAKNAGMKYLVITAKHHEGYGMWNTSTPGFTDVTGTKLYDLPHYSNFNRDVLGELKAACDVEGIKFCLYYSILDWNHPSQTITKNGPTFSAMSSLAARTAYINDMKAHLADLIVKYDPYGLWFDGDWCGNPATPTLANWWTVPDGVDLYNYLIGIKPSLVINERVKRDYGLGDYACAEGGVPGASLGRPWETCVTMNDSWGYQSNRDNSYRSVSTLVREMVKVASRDGNYLLNIGPKGDGSVPVKSLDALTGIGAWMGIYGESIYDTSASPFSSEPTWGFFTKKSGKLYAHVHNWPANGQLAIPALKNAVTRAYSLAAPATTLAHTVGQAGIVVTVPLSAPNAIDSVIVLEVTGMPDAFKDRISVGGTATASQQKLPNEGVAAAFDGTANTKWFTDASGSTAWLQYQFANGWGWTALQYEVTSANDAPERDPKTWELLGSNDGSSWTNLDSRTNQTFATRKLTKSYTVTTPGNYRYYRLNITANNGGTWGVQLSEFKLIPNAVDFQETAPPTINAPASITATATSAAGIVVTFEVTATDAVNGSPAVTVTPPSGSVFPVGTTFVQCSTSDFAGNGATAGFYVNVNQLVTPLDPSQIITPQVTMIGTTARLNLETSVAGRNYQLQRSHTLEPGTWEDLGEPKSGGAALEFTDSTVPAADKAFYRLFIYP